MTDYKRLAPLLAQVSAADFQPELRALASNGSLTKLKELSDLYMSRCRAEINQRA